MSAALTVVRPGMLTTVQDLGRQGYQGLGVPVSGPMDAYSHRLANQILGNDPGAAALEITLMGPEFIADADVTCALTGARIETTVDGAPVPFDQAFRVPAGARLRCGQRHKGARMTLAAAGGFEPRPTPGRRAPQPASPL